MLLLVLCSITGRMSLIDLHSIIPLLPILFVLHLWPETQKLLTLSLDE